MRRTMLRAKIHRATVTDANVDYVGSISLDPDLMRASDIREFEQVHVVDITNGARLVTYAIVGKPGEVCLNGAAAHLIDIGDLVIVIAYAEFDESELDEVAPLIVHVDRENRVIDESTARKLASPAHA